MSHQDEDAVQERLNSRYLAQALQWLLAGVSWKSISWRKDCTWTPSALVRAALLWAWSDESTLTERFFTARRLIAHLFPEEGPFAASYQAFVKLLCRWTCALVCLLQEALRERMQESLSGQWRISGFVVFGVDGSRMEVPRTLSQEAANAPSAERSGKKKRNRRKSRHAGHAKKANLPFLWLTVMLHVGTGLPWDWRTGPSGSSERAHALDMLDGLPQESLLTTDAGFVGYELARAVRDGGRHLLIRVGANVRLLKKLGFARESNGTVYLWPEKAAKSKQPPLVFRLVVAQGPKHPIYLITSVLSAQTLSDQQVFEIYKKRWGIELFYRHLKQTFQRRKLRSTSADNAAVELHWALVGLWSLGLSAAVELARDQIPLRRISIAGVLRAFRRMIRNYLHPVERGRTLRNMLRAALTDEYVRKQKQSRDYPRKKKHELIGIPKITQATRDQIRRAAAFKVAG